MPSFKKTEIFLKKERINDLERPEKKIFENYTKIDQFADKEQSILINIRTLMHSDQSSDFNRIAQQ